MTGRLIGVGVGPGDPEHITLKALRALHEADRVFVPAGGRAETIVALHVESDRIERIAFAMSDTGARSSQWALAGDAIASALMRGETAAFCTIGDPNLYSTFTYVAQAVRERLPGVTVEAIPGITAMQDLAARAGVVLAEGGEALRLLALGAGGEVRLCEELSHGDTVVCYKGGSRLDVVIETLAGTGRLDGAVYGEQLGLPEQRIRPAAELRGVRGPYFSTLIVPARRVAGTGRSKVTVRDGGAVRDGETARDGETGRCEG